MADRVDKKWAETGLKKYSNEAIYGTLAHYGVSIDEGKFKEQSQDRYPLDLAAEWSDGWKGTGQFAKFPYAAAMELWGRVHPDRIAPGTVAEAVVGLLTALKALQEDVPGAPVGKRLERMGELKPKIPTENGKIQEKFADELFSHFGEEVLQLFDGIGPNLARAGHIDDALEFAQWEEFLVPAREGVATALVEAAGGDKQKGLATLKALSADSARSLETRLIAIDALLNEGENDAALLAAEPVLDEAEKKEDHHLALAAAARVAHVYEQKGDRAKLKALEVRVDALQEAHTKAHPHHH